MASTACPKCQSGNVQKSSAMVEQGLRHSSGTSTGIFITSRGTVGFGGSRRRSRSYSGAVARNARSSSLTLEAWGVLAAAIVLTVIIMGQALDAFWEVNLESVLAWTICAFVVVMMAMAWAAKLTMEAQGPSDRMWDRQWYCKKCGNIFFAQNDLPSRDQTPHPSLVTGAKGLPVQGLSEPTRPAGHLTDAKVTVEVSHPRESYIQRARSPIQRARQPTTRDLAGLAFIKASVHPDGTFDPEFLHLDLGVVSRLSSTGLIRYNDDDDCFQLT